MKNNKKFLFILTSLIPLTSFAFNTSSNTENKFSSMTNIQKEPEFLSEEQAFLFSPMVDKENKQVKITFGADEGYHLYHDSLKFEIKSNNIKAGSFVIPSGEKKFIKVLGKEVEEHSGIYSFNIPLQGSGDFKLIISAQGCAAAGLCYPPFQREFNLKI